MHQQQRDAIADRERGPDGNGNGFALGFRDVAGSIAGFACGFPVSGPERGVAVSGPDLFVT